MAALGCPGNMAAVMGAMEPMEEYVQVMVGEDGDPSQVVVLQGEGGELLRPVQELSPELLQSISPTDTVYYVQPDGSLVPGGRLGEVQTGGQGVEAAAHLMAGEVEAAHLVTGGQGVEAAAHLMTGEVEAAAHLMTGGQGVEAAAHLMTGGQGVEAAAHLVTGEVEAAAHLMAGGQGVEAAQMVTEVEAAHLMAGEVEAAHLMTGEVEAIHMVTGGQGVEAAHMMTEEVEAIHMVTGGQGVEAAAHLMAGEVEAIHMVTGGQGVEAAQMVTEVEAAQMVTEVEAAHMVTGGHGVEAAQMVTEVEAAQMVTEVEAAQMVTEVEAAQMVTEVEAAHMMAEVEAAQMVTEVEAAQMVAEVEAAHMMTEGEAVHMVTGGHGVEAAHMTGEVEASQLVSEGHGDVAEDSEGQGMEAAVNLVTRVEEAVHPGLILLSGEHPGVNLITEGHVLEVVESEMNLGGQIEESVHLENGGQEDDPAEEEADMVTALNLTKETARRTQETATPEGSQVPDGATQGATHNQTVPAVPSRLPVYTAGVTMLRDAAQQLKSVAHQVALREAESLPRVLTHKELKSIHIQVPSLQPKKSAEPVVLNLSTVHLKNASPGLLGAQVVQIKSLSESRPPLVVNSSSLDSPVQIFVRQAQLPARNPPDPNNNRSYVAHPQNGAHVSADHGQKKGHKRKKTVKVKTRSGRISRPPKHKAKDYKFLKVGDTIQGSTSDSEDFSEPSSEEDEKGAKENAPCEPPLYTVKNSLFQCQTCEKSYMGKGGLSRHYRLYPSHGQMEAPFVSDDKKNGESGVGHVVPSVPKKPTPRPRKRLLEDPLNPNNSSLPNLAKDGVEFVPASSTCQGRQQVTGRRFGYPRKVLAKAPSEQNALTAKDLIQQCEDADIKEHVAPCLSARLSVCDFLIVKVKQDHPDAPLFPHLYKELENLHNRVRILAQEYFSNGGAGKTLDVADCKVAASLGISAERMNVFSPDKSSMKEEKTQSADECSGAERTPPAKRLKVEDQERVSLTKDVTTGGAPDLQEEQQRTDPAAVGASPCKNDTSSDDTTNCTEQVIEISHPNVMEEEAENQHTGPPLESAPCEENIMDASAAALGGSDCAQMSGHLPEESSGDTIQTQVVQDDTGAEEVLAGSHACQPPCTQPGAADSALLSEAPPTISHKTCREGFQGVDTFIGGEQCTQAFSFHHGQDLVFVHSSEEGAMTDGAVVIYDCAETLADTQMDAEVGLVEIS